jgi:hypothetical protein
VYSSKNTNRGSPVARESQKTKSEVARNTTIMYAKRLAMNIFKILVRRNRVLKTRNKASTAQEIRRFDEH